MMNEPTPERPLLYSLTAGLLLGLSFPPVDLAILQIPAFMLLFHLTARAGSFRELARALYPGLLLWNVIGTYWLMMATVAGGVAAILANALIMLLPLELIRRLMKHSLPPLLLAILAGAIWTTYEFAHHHWELAWPWLTLGNAWSNLPFLVQYISYTGHLAISFWIVTASLLSWIAARSLDRLDFLHALAVTLLFPGISWTVDNHWREAPGDPVNVVVVQPNLDSYEALGGKESLDEVADLLLELSDMTRREETDLIVWPENAISQAIGRNHRLNRRFRDSLQVWQTELITGAGFMEIYGEAGLETPAIHRTTSDGRAWNLYNAALHLTGDGLIDVYKKGQLVPVVERFPYAGIVQRLDLFGWIPWDNIIGYGRGEQTNNFAVAGTRTPALICYDSVYPTWVNGFVREGAGFLTIITNDGWWGDTSGHHQHFAYARLRAIEQRQWIVRAANNGISGIISPEGAVRERTGYWTRTAFTREIYPTEERTFFSRYGNWFGWLMTGMTLTGMALQIYLRRRGESLNADSRS